MRYIVGLLIILFLILGAGYYYLVYFNPLPEIVVPDVGGMPFKMATEKLEEFGLRVHEAGRVFDAKYPVDYVVSQRPEPGRKVKVGRIVNLIVSSGREKTTVPNLIGRPLAQAEAVLSAAQLRLGKVKKENQPQIEEGTIMAQDPLPNEEVLVGIPVDLVVSTTLEVVEETEEKNEQN
ncbi:MAG: PASTA domain-containing protein [Candidatus Margulisiibacteriota bacterium]